MPAEMEPVVRHCPGAAAGGVLGNFRGDAASGEIFLQNTGRRTSPESTATAKPCLRYSSTSSAAVCTGAGVGRQLLGLQAHLPWSVAPPDICSTVKASAI